MRRDCRAFTLIELTVSMALMGLVLAILGGLQLMATAGTARVLRGADSAQSVLTAVELMSGDLRRLVYQVPGDVAVLNQGRGLSFLIPRPLGDDLWNTETTSVTYRLERHGHRRGHGVLVRIVDGVRSRVAGCLLSDMEVAVKEDRLQITLVSGEHHSRFAVAISRDLHPPAPFAEVL